jgi:ADP-ribosylglycohydrolase
MRIAPPVFCLAGKPEAERFHLTKTVSSITRAHPWSVAACFIYLEYLRKPASGTDKTAAYTELRRDFQEGSPHVSQDTLDKFSRILRTDISALPESGIKSGGFVIDTQEAALWCFLTAVLKAVNLGDDTDTAAAVTGALAGLERIPPDRLDALAASGDIRRLAGAMAGALAA